MDYPQFELDEESSSIVEASVPTARPKLIFPHLSIDGHTRRVEVEGVPVRLTTNEFEILYLLACSPGKAVSAKEIYHCVWRMEDLGNISPVQVHISNLRVKLREACPERAFISTVWKKGYLLLANK